VSASEHLHDAGGKEMTFEEAFTAHINREGSAELLNWLKSTDFFTAPGSTRFHGCHEGGLADHSVNVFIELRRLLAAFPEINVSDETIAIVTLLHDVCKAGCYKTEMRNRKNDRGQWEKYPVYTFNEDFAFGGHGSKSVFLVQQHIDLLPEEAVAINCHMGPWDRSPGDYSLGTAYERYPLAWLLHVADESATYIREGKL
jgi:hypothetical protein